MPEQTIRQHLDAAQAAFSDMEKGYKTTCHEMFAHTMAALHLLENARAMYRCQPGCFDCDIHDEPWRSNNVRIRLIDDPEPRDA